MTPEAPPYQQHRGVELKITSCTCMSPRISNHSLQILICALLLASGLALPGQLTRGEAQSDSAGWSTPVNLSGSGIASNPHLILLPEGEALAVWDEATGSGGVSALSNGVTRRRKGEWQAPSRTGLAWAGRPTQFIAGENGQIHGFWIDSDNNLLYRAVSAGEFSNPAVWSSGMQLGTEVFSFDATMDTEQRLHVAFLTAGGTTTAVPGTYYQRSGANGLGWSSARQVYASEYYRKFEGGDAIQLFGEEVATLPAVDVEAGDEAVTSVYLAWDNPSLKRMYMAISKDEGASWEAPFEVRGPDSSDPYATPREPLIQALDRQVLLLWRVYQSGGSCEQLYRLSTDQGKTWGPDGLVLGEEGRCPDTIQAFQVSPNRLLAFLTLQSQAFVMGWNGRQWTAPRAQPELDSFPDENTLTFVELDCRQADLKDGVLAVVGCDRGFGGDIWVMEQPVDLATLFGTPPPTWSIRPPMTLEASEVLSLSAAGNDSAMAQVLWSAPSEGTGTTPASDVYYVGIDSESTIGPIRVLRSQPGGVSQIDLVVDPTGRLLGVWSGGELGQVYYTGTSVEEAASPAGWIAPEPVSPSPGQSPSLARTESGASQLIYAVPVNENRGVYGTRLDPESFVWTPVVRVHSAASPPCPVVADSDVAVAGEERVYAIWSCWTSPGGVGPMAAYFSASVDGGVTWSPAAAVISTGPLWTELVSTREGDLHLIWGEARSGGETTWHAWSADGGLHWTAPDSVKVFDGVVGAAEALADAAGSLHLVQVVEKEGSKPEVMYSSWEDGRWEDRPGMPLWGEHIDDLAVLSLAVRDTDQLLAVYAALGPLGPEGVREMGIVTAEFPLGPMPAQPPAPSSISQTEVATDSATPTPADSATATPPAGGEAAKGGGAVVGPALGLLAAAVLIGAGVWFVRRRRAQRPASP